jgi:hypothetical protein
MTNQPNKPNEPGKSVSLKNIESIKKMIPAIKTSVLKGIGHMPTMQDSGKFNAILLEELSESFDK